MLQWRPVVLCQSKRHLSTTFCSLERFQVPEDTPTSTLNKGFVLTWWCLLWHYGWQWPSSNVWFCQTHQTTDWIHLSNGSAAEKGLRASRPLSDWSLSLSRSKSFLCWGQDCTLCSKFLLDEVFAAVDMGPSMKWGGMLRRVDEIIRWLP